MSPKSTCLELERISPKSTCISTGTRCVPKAHVFQLVPDVFQKHMSFHWYGCVPKVHVFQLVRMCSKSTSFSWDGCVPKVHVSAVRRLSSQSVRTEKSISPTLNVFKVEAMSLPKATVSQVRQMSYTSHCL